MLMKGTNDAKKQLCSIKMKPYKKKELKNK